MLFLDDHISFPILWKFSQIIMFAKSDKHPDNPATFRPVSYITIFDKNFWKTHPETMSSNTYYNNILPYSQFCFRVNHTKIPTKLPKSPSRLHYNILLNYFLLYSALSAKRQALNNLHIIIYNNIQNSFYLPMMLLSHPTSYKSVNFPYLPKALLNKFVYN